MRGAHRDVWCSKAQSLIEAELFAAERCRPAQDGRALLCAAPYAREIQGSKASKNLPDARNRAPVTPVSLRDRRESRRKGGLGGVKRGRETLGSLPLLPPPPGGGNPRPPKAAIVHAHLGRAYPILLTARCTACSARFAACCAECRSDGFSIALAATMLITAPATAPVATPDTNGDTCILLPPFFAFFSAALRAAPLLCPAAPAFFLRQR